VEVATTRNPKAGEGARLSFHQFPALRLCEMRASGNALSGLKKTPIRAAKSAFQNAYLSFRMPIYIEAFFLRHAWYPRSEPWVLLLRVY